MFQICICDDDIWNNQPLTSVVPDGEIKYKINKLERMRKKMGMVLELKMAVGELARFKLEYMSV